jgi:small subunit ribosomal protein S16
MAASIRLKRVGAKKAASFRIVVTDTSQGTSGISIERLGVYNPRTEPSLIRLDAARTLYWLHEGAEPSDTVRSLLRQTGVWKQFHDGVAPEALEDPVVFQGPPPGQQGTSQRPPPVDRAPKVSAAAAVAKEVMPEAEPAAAPEAAEPEAAEEAAAPEEPTVAEATAEAEETVEASVDEATAEAEEAVEVSAEELAETAEEAAEESEVAAGEAVDASAPEAVEEAVEEVEETAEAEVEEVTAEAEDAAEEAVEEAAEETTDEAEEAEDKE